MKKMNRCKKQKYYKMNKKTLRKVSQALLKIVIF